MLLNVVVHRNSRQSSWFVHGRGSTTTAPLGLFVLMRIERRTSSGRRCRDSMLGLACAGRPGGSSRRMNTRRRTRRIPSQVHHGRRGGRKSTAPWLLSALPSRLIMVKQQRVGSAPILLLAHPRCRRRTRCCSQQIPSGMAVAASIGRGGGRGTFDVSFDPTIGMSDGTFGNRFLNAIDNPGPCRSGNGGGSTPSCRSGTTSAKGRIPSWKGVIIHHVHIHHHGGHGIHAAMTRKEGIVPKETPGSTPSHHPH